MSLQPNSQPEARSLVLFLLLWHNYWFSRQGLRPPAPWTWSKESGLGLRVHVQARLGSHFQHQLPKNTSGFCFSTFPKGFRGQNKFIFKGCRKNKIESGKKGLVSHEIFGLNQLEIEILWANFIWNFTLEVKMSGSYWIMVQQQIS